MSTRAELAHILTITAQACNFALDAWGLSIYVDDLERFPVEQVKVVLRDAFRRRKMPSVVEIIEALEGKPPELTTRDEASEVADRIAAAIERDGYTNPTRARERIGELGWVVVEQCGGWSVLCRSVESYDQLPTFKAQWRTSAEAAAKKAKLGRLGEPPALPAPVGRVGALQSASGLVRGLLGGGARED
jgi:hypothetical protein